MLNIENISKIGIGTYRMSIQNKTHLESLSYALDNGINLLDTASNYLQGDSERLIGKALSSGNREKLFIVSKAGYLQGNDLTKFSDFLNQPQTIKINNGFYYSIDKKFLELQINETLNKLGTDYLDGFLVHNPEHYFDVPNSLQNDLQSHVLESLHYLEGLVKKGVIRYYGISSNTFPYPDKKDRLNIEKIISAGDNLPNFKLIQFPYNLIENNASHKSNNEISFIDFCKQSDLKMFSNRPLNTVYKSKVLRLADYSNEVRKLDMVKERKMFDNLLSSIKEKLVEFGEDSAPSEFTPIRFFIENRKKIANPDAVNKAINGHLIPFLSQIELNNQETFSLINELQEQWILYSKKFITERTTKLRHELISGKIIEGQDNRDFSTIACEHYLEKGIDHVLIGMRKKEYVKNVIGLL